MNKILEKKELRIKNFKQKGIAMLFAVLMTVILVSIAATITSIALRQTILSGTGRESQFAYYAANTALECALYWDLNPDTSIVDEGNNEAVFPINSLSGINQTLVTDNDITCNGGSIQTGGSFTSQYVQVEPWDQNSNKTTFRIQLDPEDSDGNKTGPYCAEVMVEKELNNVTGNIITVITSKGYNTCELDSPRAVERGLQLSYTS